MPAGRSDALAACRVTCLYRARGQDAGTTSIHKQKHASIYCSPRGARLTHHPQADPYPSEANHCGRAQLARSAVPWLRRLPEGTSPCISCAMRSSGCSAAICRIVDGHVDGMTAENALLVTELSAAFKVGRAHPSIHETIRNESTRASMKLFRRHPFTDVGMRAWMLAVEESSAAFKVVGRAHRNNHKRDSIAHESRTALTAQHCTEVRRGAQREEEGRDGRKRRGRDALQFLEGR